MNHSIQRTLSLWLSTAILLAGLLAATASFFFAWKDASESQDAQLGQVADAVARQSLQSNAPELLPKDLDDAETRFVIAPLGMDAGASNPAINLRFPKALSDGLQTIDLNGNRWRVLVRHDSKGTRFGAAQNMKARDEDATASAIFVLIPLGLLVPVLLIAVHVALRRAFAPLASLSAQADRVHDANRAALELNRVPTEVLPFVQAVNRLLGRLSDALDQQRRFIADAAHELRSPVTALVIQADNINHVALGDEARSRVRTLQTGLRRMSSLLDQLLNLARAQNFNENRQGVVRLDQVTIRVIEDQLPHATAKRIDLGCAHLDEVQIRGDAQHAMSLVRNAIDNAVRYTPMGGAVDVSLALSGSTATLIVRDTGPGIGEEDRVRVFAPFVRVLGHEESGSGLGLAITRAAAHALGGTIELATRQDGATGLVFIYRQAAAAVSRSTRQGFK